MILTCSSCATRFLVDAAAVGPAGRHVRCARCQHGWFQEPAADLPRSVTDLAGGQAASAQDMRARDGRPPPPSRPAPLRRGANLPALPRKPSPIAGIVSWGALALFITGVLGGGYIFRDQITHEWPASAPLYEALGFETAFKNLRFADVSFALSQQDDHPLLTVKGAIINDGAAEVDTPVLLVRLRNAAGRDIFQWTFQIPAAKLGAGAREEFETSLADPPPDARNLEVTVSPGG